MVKQPAPTQPITLKEKEKPVRFSLDLTQADYSRLCAEWVRRRDAGKRVSMRALIVEAITAHIPEGPKRPF